MEENINQDEQQNQKEEQNFSTNPELEKPAEHSKGALIGTIIVIILLLVVGGYIFLTRLNTTRNIGSSVQAQKEAQEILSQPDTQLENLSAQSNSDGISKIEEDVNNTDLGGIDLEIGSIDNEIKGGGF